jgi:hypothetical protein
VLPRVVGLGRFVTVDEIDHWIDRSAQFLTAIQAGNLAGTAITSHPGVTTMWLGGMGLMSYQRALAWALVPEGSFAIKLAFMQYPVALVNAAGVVLGYHLLRRMLPAAVAICAALFWAADPFVIGYSRVLHVDALAGTFLTLSILAACVYWHHTPRASLLALSGCMGGLALLSKSPAAVVLPLVAAIALTARSPRSAIGALAVWGGCCALTIGLLWPATLAEPIQVFKLLLSGVEENGAVPHSNGNYFLGQFDPAPGPLFYPVALALRSTPWTLIGLLLLPLALRRAGAPARRDLAVLAALVIALTVGLTLFPKKHNRYLEPAFPAADVLAAAGLVSIAGAGRNRAVLGTAILGTLAIGNAAGWHPYGIAAFNQLLGGAPAGANTFLIGWGEGLEQAADWINRQPDSANTLIATTLKEPLGLYLRPGMRTILPLKDIPEQTSYLVVYVRNAQDGPPDPPFDQFYGQVAPAHVVEVEGVPYAWIYQVPPRVERLASANFGATLRLRGYTLAASPGGAGTYAVRLWWETLRATSSDYAVFVHLIGPDGRRYAQADPPIQTQQFGASHYLATNVTLQLPPDAPPGAYQVIIGAYTPENGQRLTITEHTPADPALDGPHAIVLDTIQHRP